MDPITQTHLVLPEGLTPQLLGAAVNGFLLLGAVAVGLWLWRRGSAAERHFAWLTALGGLILLPLLPQWELPVARPSWAGQDNPVTNFVVTNFAITLTNAAQADETVATGGLLKIPPSQWPSAQPDDPPGGSVLKPAAAHLRYGLEQVWLAGCGILLTAMGVGYWRRFRLQRQARACDDARSLAVLAEECAGLKLPRHPALLVLPGAVMPMTWGSWKPVILLPEMALAWPASELRLVLRHELAHIQRWDSLTQGLTQIFRAVFWFNPLVWLACRRMRWERERACDDQVVRGGARPSDYAECLLDLSRRLSAPSPMTVLPAARKSGLERRLQEILNPTGRRHGLHPLTAVVIVTVYLGGILFFFGPESRQPEPKPDGFPRLQLSQQPEPKGDNRPTIQVDRPALGQNSGFYDNRDPYQRVKTGAKGTWRGPLAETFEMDKQGLFLPV